MKYILLIVAMAASLGLTSANSAPSKQANGCCNGGGCCGPHKACCKAGH